MAVFVIFKGYLQLNKEWRPVSGKDTSAFFLLYEHRKNRSGGREKYVDTGRIPSIIQVSVIQPKPINFIGILLPVMSKVRLKLLEL